MVAVGGRRWKVVGTGPRGGGVIARVGKSSASAELPVRLEQGALVEEIDLDGERLHFRALSGKGQGTKGWVRLKRGGEDVLVCLSTTGMQHFTPDSFTNCVPEAKPTACPSLTQCPTRPLLRETSPRTYKGSQDPEPMCTWACLAELYLEQSPQTNMVAAAETSGHRGLNLEDLPPMEELETASEETLTQVIGFPATFARYFVNLDGQLKRRFIAEAKAYIKMTEAQRQDYMQSYRRAWPAGPFPSLLPEADSENQALSHGTCFPLSRRLRDVSGREDPAWGLGAPVVTSACNAYFNTPKHTSPHAQREFLRSMKCDVLCTGDTIKPDFSSWQDCRLQGQADQHHLVEAAKTKSSMRPSDVAKYLNSLVSKRMLFLDGSIHARIDAANLTEAEYRGDRFKSLKETTLKGNHELLNITKPELITEIYKEYFMAGCDICRTNSLGSTASYQKGYKMQMVVYELNKASALLAKKAAAEVTKLDPSKPRFVAGVIGPLDMPSGEIWDELMVSYEEQIRGLLEGGVDLLMLDGVRDTVSAKAALFAVEEHFAKSKKPRIPIIVSTVLQDTTGRTPCAQTLEAFCISMKHAKPFSVGTACALNEKETRLSYKEFATGCTSWCHLCPSAVGQDPEAFATQVLAFAEESPVNIVGGGEGALPAHIAALVEKGLSTTSLRQLPEESLGLQLSGDNACAIKTGEEGCYIVGQQCTSMGSANFRRLVAAYKKTRSEEILKKAVSFCATQCKKGADIIDVNLDSDSVDGVAETQSGIMSKFVQLCLAEPSIAKLPMMLSSYEWEIIEEGLKAARGRCLVNAICLMLGEQEFLRIARECKRHGAAVVVLAISERGIAEGYDDKVRVCQRSYKLLRSKLDFPPEDIAFDGLCSLIGVEENARSSLDLINAIGEIRRTCPGVSLIAGVSNISLGFRGLNTLREAFHSVFLHHAVPRGLNLCIALPGSLPPHPELDPELRTLCEELVLNTSADGNHLARFMAFLEFKTGGLVCLPVPAGSGSRDRYQDTASTTVAKAELLNKRRLSSIAAQKDYWKSLECRLLCIGEQIKPQPDLLLPNLCRLEGVVHKEKLCETILAKRSLWPDEVAKYFNSELRERLCILAMGMEARLQAEDLTEQDFRGNQFTNFDENDSAGDPIRLQGRHELLSLTKPDLVERITREYFHAGADVVGTNTYNGSAVSLKACKLDRVAYELNKAAAQLAKRAAAEVTARQPDKPRFVAGVIGPTNHRISTRTVTWDELVRAYLEQIHGLVDGGVDILALELVSDTLNAKAAIYAINQHFVQAQKEKPPIFINVTVWADSGRTSTGQTIEAFAISVKHARPFAIGVTGAENGCNLMPVLKTMALQSPSWCYVTAERGNTQTAAAPANEKLVNFVGSGSGAMPTDLEAIVASMANLRGRILPARPSEPFMQLCGTEACLAKPENGVQMVGQRCNIMGCTKFQALIEAYKVSRGSWDAVVDLALKQYEDGADLLDINVDSEVIDDVSVMGKFVRLCSNEPKVGRLPLVLSSIKWPVIEEGLRNVQGKCIVNGISLVQGEEQFLRLARACQHYGAAIVVVAVEAGGAMPNQEDKVRICQRGYRLLRSKLDFPPEDIIFDCGVVPVGIPAPQANGVRECMDAMAKIKKSCPLVSFIGGISNSSLGYRDVPLIRTAMHSVLLHHAIQQGLNFAIVDPGELPCYPDLEVPTQQLCEDVILTDLEEAAFRLQKFAAPLASSVVVSNLVAPLPATRELDALPLLSTPEPRRLTPQYRSSITHLVQSSGATTASIFQTFGCKSHTAFAFHKLQSAQVADRSVMFSSISVYMGQGGAGPVTGSSGFLDATALWERHQSWCNMSCAVEWGAIGEIGLRLAIYGSRDVFAQFDLGQKLILPADAQFLERQLLTCSDVLEVVGMAYLDATWQGTLAGTQTGTGLSGRKTFADM